MTNIIGIDLGTLKAALVCIRCGDVYDTTPVVVTEEINYKSKDFSVKERYLKITSELLDRLNQYKPKILVVEYPFNIQGNAKVLLEMYGVIRYWALQKNIEFYGVPQTSLKKYATGNGKASKDDVLEAYNTEQGVVSDSYDIADAYWAAKIGFDYRYADELFETLSEHRLSVISRMRKEQL